MPLKAAVKQILPEKTYSFLRRVKHKYLNRNTGVRLYKRLERLFEVTPEINTLFPYQDFAVHYAYEPARQSVEYPDIYANQVRYYRMFKYFQKFYPDMFDPDVKIADVGDTSGTLFRVMKRKGLSVNINEDVVQFIQKNGIEAQTGNIEQLPFQCKEFDYTYCFQCLEHVPNPVQALSELSRITKKGIFISIPYVTQTRIYGVEFWQDLKKKPVSEGGWNEREVRDVDGHKFEFSAEDFKKVMSHAGLVCVDHFPLNYFSPLGANRKPDGTYFNFFIVRPAKDSIDHA